MTRWLRRVLGPALAAALALVAAPAFAQTYTATITNADLGKIVDAPSSATTFTFAASNGGVSQSGSATRLSTGTVRAEVDFGCTGSGSVCASDIAVKIQSSGAYTGKASAITNFTVSGITNGTIGPVTGTDPITFTITGVPNKNNLPKIYVGATVTINGNSQSGTNGASTAGFTVLAAKSGSVPATITGGSGSVTAVVDRPITFTSTATTLQFGTIYNPKSGTSTIKLDPNLASNPITVTGGDAIAVASPTPARVAYSIQGEGGQTFSVSTTAMNMSNGTNTLPVTLLTSTPLPTALSLSPGSAGTATFYVGGQFDVTPTTPGGTYTGTFNVT
ncbi:MAG: DUF4402 domain-containing protein, partial [Ignavibacteriales bacterium]